MGLRPDLFVKHGVCSGFYFCTLHGISNKKRICGFLQLTDALQQGFIRGCLFHSFSYCIPVHDAPKSVDMVGAFILIIQVVSMFPNVEAQQRGQSRTYGIASVGFFGDMQFTVLVYAQPEPNNPTAAALNSFLKFSKLPKSRLIASASFPVGSL